MSSVTFTHLPRVGFESLPQELIDAVVSQNQDDPATLHACALVNSSWTRTAQKHLFSRVHLYDQSPSRYYRAKPTKISHIINHFHELITAYPHLALMVKSVEVVPLLDASQEECLGLTLQKLANLEHISLDFGGYYWDELSPWMRDTLLTTIRSPRITNVELREGLFLRSADFLALLGACEHLKRLSLFYMSCDDLEDIIDSHDASLPKGMSMQLDSLTLSLHEHSYLPLMHRLLRHGETMDLSHLHRLSVLTAGTGHPSERIETTKEILRLNSHSLEHLVLNVCLGEPLSKLIDITQLRSIQVKLWWVRFDPYTDAVEWLRWLSSMFKDLVGQHVEQVIFEVFYCGEVTRYQEEWNALDGALAGIPSLRSVEVKLNCYDCAKGRWMYFNEYPSTLAGEVKRILPAIAKRSILFHEFAAQYPS